MVSVDYDAYVAMVKVPRTANPFSKDGKLGSAFASAGYYYGPIGTFRDIPNIEKYKVLLQLRDPRDVLTSLYYSTSFSHAVISRKLIRRRKTALKQSVDDFVIASINEYLPIYTIYCDKLLNHSNTLFLKYEEMVLSFPNWLNKLGNYLEFSDQQNTINHLVAESDFTVATEDIYAQKRQVTPGDYLRKLQPQTINELNLKFADVLQKLNYQI